MDPARTAARSNAGAPGMHPSAPAIQAGDPLDDMNVYLALQEFLTRFRYHQIDPTVVGPVDVAAALIRLEFVTRQHAIEVYYENGLVPRWFAAYQQQLEGLSRTVQQLQDDKRPLEARLWNIQAVAHNSRCVQDCARQQAFRPFRKATPGIGEPLTNSSPPRRAVPSLGLVPPEFFPKSYTDLQDWDLGRINELSILLSEDFGIAAGDSLHQSRA